MTTRICLCDLSTQPRLPKAAIVFTFGLDPRTVDDRWRRSGQHGQKVHQDLVLQPRELLHVQMDEIRRKIQGAIPGSRWR